MPWLVFALSAAVVVAAAHRLAKYGDVIAVRTGLGGLFVGMIFLAAATSLPELMTSISAFRAGQPDLAAGNFFGSNMVNILMLALVDMVHRSAPLLRRVAVTHAMTATLANVLMLTAAVSMLVGLDLRIGWVGLDSLFLIAVYVVGVWFIRQEEQLSTMGSRRAGPAVKVEAGFPSLRAGAGGFAIAALVLIAVVPQLVGAAVEIAEITGLGASFVGTVLLSIVTSLPELLAALMAVRIGAYDLAVGNIFGSSVFNMLAVGLSDFFYTPGPLLAAIDPSFVLVLLLALVLTNIALGSNLARVERRVWYFELDALLIVVTYVVGLYLLFVRGVAL